MKILLVGNGAREHAICSALKRSPKNPGLFAFMTAKNPGIVKLCKDFKIGDTCDAKAVCDYALNKNINFVVVGPEAPLAAGVCDELENNGIGCVGPKKVAAQIETNKAFARNLMKKYKIPGTPEFKVFTDAEQAVEFIKNSGKDWAIKPAGLTGGKGVKIMGEHLKNLDEVRSYIKKVLTTDRVIIEEKLIGEEVTIQAFVDGKTVIGTPMVQDHKRAYEGDVGPNTGGMGSYSDKGYILPFLTQEDYDAGIEIMKRAVLAIKKETGVEYKGFLYGQFIIAEKLMVIEFNARFGDPEAMNTFSILKSDFVEICKGIINGNLNEIEDLKFKDKATVCKYIVPGGYPENPKSGLEIVVDEKKIEEMGALIYYAAVDEKDNKIYTSSSRAAGIVGIADTIEDAEKIAENAVECVKGDVFHRKDIGTCALVQKRVEHIRVIRGYPSTES
ncbi:MAG: phosphoribosylamine--glycine ligase [Candidatus Altiarchaeales archaeon HGW-Altiarchaeales-3]|nr:MAG: phosphoribosylamine--glycine ligase [Candidatus Altiarchaeales archaeon HGW-Altiarchaeales-3]